MVVTSDAVVGGLECDGGRRRDAQPKYTPDSISEIHGVRLLSTGRLAVGIPSCLEPRPKPLITLPSIRRGKGASSPAEGPTMSGRAVVTGFAVDRRWVALLGRDERELVAAFVEDMASSMSTCLSEKMCRLRRVVTLTVDSKKAFRLNS